MRRTRRRRRRAPTPALQRIWAEIGRLAIRLERTFAGLVAQGIGLWLGLQAFINMGVNMGLLPTKGLTLPLLSFGGTGIAFSGNVSIALQSEIDLNDTNVVIERRRATSPEVHPTSTCTNRR